MESDRNPLLETDALAPAPEATEPSQPVVLVQQYRNRGVPLWVIVLLVFVMPLLSILVYHRLVVRRYHAQAMQEAEEALETWIDRRQPGKLGDPAGEPRAPLALNSTPITEDRSPRSDAQSAISVPPAPTSTGASSPPAPASPAAVTAGAPPPAAGPGETVKEAAKITAVRGTETKERPSNEHSAAQTKSSPPEKAPVVSAAPAPKEAPDAEPKPKGLRTILQFPPPSEERREGPSPAADGANLPAQGRGNGTYIPSPFETPDPPPRDDPKDGAGGEAPPAGATSPPGAVPDPAPLPTKEQSLRQIAEEAAKKREELDRMQESKQAELLSLRNEERQRFRDELRELLELHGNEAGPEIEKLIRRQGFDVTKEGLRAADKIWFSRQLSLAAKIRAIRALNLPETVILDRLSDDLNRLARTRRGPRTAGQVRVRAARELLLFEISPSEAHTPAGSRPAGASDRGR